MSKQLQFQNHTIEILERDGGLWVKGSAICGVLGYKEPINALSDIYKRHKSEFSADMVSRPAIKTNGGWQRHLCFSLRGAHLLAMFSKTPVAVEFRKWVLDVLEKESQPLAQLPSPKTAQRMVSDSMGTMTLHSQAEHALRALHHLAQARAVGGGVVESMLITSLVELGLKAFPPKT